MEEFYGVDPWVRVVKKSVGGDVRGLIVPKRALRGAYEARGYTSSQFAEMMRVSPSTVTAWTKGDRLMKSPDVFRAARILNVSAALVLSGYGSDWAKEAVRTGQNLPTFDKLRTFSKVEPASQFMTYAQMYGGLVNDLLNNEIAYPLDLSAIVNENAFLREPINDWGYDQREVYDEGINDISPDEWVRESEGRANFFAMFWGRYPHDLRSPQGLFMAHARFQGEDQGQVLLRIIDELDGLTVDYNGEILF